MPASGSPERSDRQRALWRKLQPFLWETGIAASFLTEDEVLARIDYPSYFDLTDQPLPNSRHGIVQRLSEDRIIFPDAGGRWNITHLGAILFAKRLDQFDSSIARKAVRFTSYDGPSRADTVVYRVGGRVAPPVPPHHRAYGTVHGGSSGPQPGPKLIEQAEKSPICQ